MIQLLALAQSVSIETTISDRGPAALAIGLIGGAAVAGAIIGLLLKFVGAAVLNHPVRFGNAFLVAFIATLVSGAVEIGLLQSGVIPPVEFNPDGSLLEQIMRIGPMGFVISEGVTFLALLWSVRSFLLGSNDERPGWGKTASIALIVTIFQIGFAFAALRLSAGLQ